MQFRVVFVCILLQKPKKPLRSVDDADDELDDASSVQIILPIRVVHIIFFRISTQKGPPPRADFHSYLGLILV